MDIKTGKYLAEDGKNPLPEAVQRPDGRECRQGCDSPLLNDGRLLGECKTPTPVIVDGALLDSVSAQAAASPRRRKNHNFHSDNAAPCHRLLNGIEPDSYVAPHRHAAADKDETILALRGRMGMVFFDENGGVTAKTVIEPNGAALAVDIPHGVFHTVVALVDGSIFFEAKAGPWQPLTPDERAPWAQPEGAPEAAEYLEKLKKLF